MCTERKAGGLIVLLSILPLFLFIALVEGKNIYVSHLYFILFIFYLMFAKPFRLNRVILSFLVVFLFLLFLASAGGHGYGERFLADYIKVIIYVFSIYIIATSYSKYELERFLIIIISVFVVTFPIYAVFYYLNNGDLFAYSGRLYIEYYGSPNVFASLVGAFLLVSFYTNSKRLYKCIIIPSLFVLLFLCFSRAIFVSLSILYMLVYMFDNRSVSTFSIKSIILLIVSLVVALIFYNSGFSLDNELVVHALEKGDSNRFELWGIALEELYETPSAWLFGLGPGKILTEYFAFGEFLPMYHPHNTYVFLLYSFGIVGFLLFLIVWIGLGYKIMMRSGSNKLQLMLYIYYSLIFIFDVHLSASQVVPFHIFILGYMFMGDNDTMSKNVMLHTKY